MVDCLIEIPLPGRAFCASDGDAAQLAPSMVMPTFVAGPENRLARKRGRPNDPHGTGSIRSTASRITARKLSRFTAQAAPARLTSHAASCEPGKSATAQTAPSTSPPATFATC